MSETNYTPLRGVEANEEVEHDDIHFTGLHRLAVLAIQAEQQGTTYSSRILDEVSCPRCFCEVLIAIAAKLGNPEEVTNAGQEALTDILTDTGWRRNDQKLWTGPRLGDVKKRTFPRKI